MPGGWSLFLASAPIMEDVTLCWGRSGEGEGIQEVK